MDVLRQDLRHALRTLRRQPTFAAVVILTVGVGIGVNTAVFTLVHSTLLAPLPYFEPQRLAMLWTEIPAQGVSDATSSYANIMDWKAQNRAFEDLATFDPTTLTVTDGAFPEQVATARVSANLFALLGVSPAVGRTFSLEEERQRAAVVVLSDEYWRSRFGASRAAIGNTIEIAGTRLEVVGVMPPGLAFPERSTQLWLPQTLFTQWDAVAARRGTDAWRVIGRLRTDVSLERARADMSALAARLESLHPAANAGLGIHIVPLDEQVTGRSYRQTLWLLFGAVALVLLIACANAAQLIVARGMDRSKEFALRQAIGATGSRLIRQSLTENIVLSLAAGAAGLLLALVSMRVLAALAPANVPRIDEIAIDAPVLLYTAGVSLLAGVLFGAAPVMGALRADLFGTLREGMEQAAARRGHRARSLLIVLQFSLAVVLVFGANLLIRSLLAARSVDPGFATENVFLANLSVEQASGRVEFYERIVEDVRSIPGVRAAGIVEDLFISGAPNRPIEIEGRGAQAPAFEQLRVDAVAGDVFEAIGVTVREGRAFAGSDRADAVPVAIINETMSHRFWPGESAIGRRFRTGGAQAPWVEIVGVVGDMRRQGLERTPIMQVFRPYAQEPSRNMNLLVTSELPAETLAPTIRARIGALDGTVPLYHVTSVAAALDRYLLERRFQTFLLGLFSTIALVLAAVGIYGVLQYSVARRARELGLRAALGATANGLSAMVLRQALLLALPGLAAGILCAIWLADTASALMFGVSAYDPTSLLLPCAIMLLTAVGASWIPARRAARADPMAALRMQ